MKRRSVLKKVTAASAVPMVFVDNVAGSDVTTDDDIDDGTGGGGGGGSCDDYPKVIDQCSCLDRASDPCEEFVDKDDLYWRQIWKKYEKCDGSTYWEYSSSKCDRTYDCGLNSCSMGCY